MTLEACTEALRQHDPDRFGAVLVAAGRAGDLLGRGWLFLAGLVVFGLGSLLAGLAPSPLLLNLARIVMGIGSGLLNPQGIGMIQQFFSGKARGIALACSAASSGSRWRSARCSAGCW